MSVTSLTPATGTLRVLDLTAVQLIQMHMDILRRLRLYGYASPTALTQLCRSTVPFTLNRGKHD